MVTHSPCLSSQSENAGRVFSDPFDKYVVSLFQKKSFSEKSGSDNTCLKGKGTKNT